jgi:hypothetical protein
VRNVTITLDEETAQCARIEAARRDTSVSRWFGQLLEERRRTSLDSQRARDASLHRSGAPLTPHGSPLPSRDELHER